MANTDFRVKNGLTVDGIITGKAVSGEGGEIDLNNPDNASIGLYVDVSTADVGRIFSVRNNSTLQLGQLQGTGGIVTMWTAGSERVRVDASGVIIIGSGEGGATPVGNTLRGPAGAGTNIAGANLTITAGNGTGTGGSGNIYFQTAPTGSTGSSANTMATVMTMLANGNVGIGTSPSYTLDVNGTTRSGKLLAGAITATSDTARIRTNGDIYMDAAVSTLAYNLYYDTGWNYRNNGPGFAWRSDGTSLMQLLSAVSGTGGTAASVSTPLTITTSGNVGIGASPSYELDVYKASTAVDYISGRFVSDAAATGQSQTWVKFEKSGNYGGAIAGYLNQGVNSGLLLGTQNNSATPTERMRIDSRGNVGIGTASPVGRLHVSGTDATGPTSLRLQNTTATTGKTWQITSTDAGLLQLATQPGVADYMTVDSSGNVSMTGTISASNINRTYGLPNVNGTASWIKLGTFTAGQGGHHCFIKVVTTVGYNAITAQQNEIYIHFLTSNGVSVDANGFGGFTQFYITNTNGSSYNVKVVSNAAGVSATSYDIWFYQAGAYNGTGSFYTVEINNGNTWTNIATTGSDPGVASSTIGIGVNAMAIGSNTLPTVNNSLSLGSDTLRWSGVYSTNFYRAGTRLPTFTTASSAPSSPIVGDCWYKSTSDIFYQYVNDGTSSFWLSLNTYPSSYANLGVTSTLTVSGTVSSSLVPTANNTYNLGSASALWSNVYGTNLYGTLQTAAQTNITSVGTLSSLSVTGGNSLITPSTNFAAGSLDGSAMLSWSNSVNNAGWSFSGVDNRVLSIVLGGNNHVTLRTAGNLDVIGNLLPYANNTYNLGSASLKWATMYGVASQANYADLAEKYTADDNYEPGTVLEFGGTNEVTISNTDMSRKIAGIVSTNPGYLMNAELKSEFVISLALTGRVPCKVQGKVRKGDMMVSASNGYARAEEDPKLGSVIGKALEDFNGITGIIEVVVGRL